MYSGFSVARKKLGTTYRKTIGVYNYKIGHQKYHKEPGAVDLHTVETLKKTGTLQSLLKLRNMRRDSPRVMGHFVGRQFKVDQNKIPLYDIPDLTGFELKPYVSYHTPQIDGETKSRLLSLNDYKRPENLVTRSQTKLLDKE